MLPGLKLHQQKIDYLQHSIVYEYVILHHNNGLKPSYLTPLHTPLPSSPLFSTLPSLPSHHLHTGNDVQNKLVECHNMAVDMLLPQVGGNCTCVSSHLHGNQSDAQSSTQHTGEHMIWARYWGWGAWSVYCMVQRSPAKGKGIWGVWPPT